MKQLSSIIDDLVTQPVRRDRWGRYLVLPEGAAKPVGYTRATTIAKGIEDSGGLLGWGKRMVAIGLAQRPDLVALVSTTPDTDKKTLDSICERAAEQGGATVRRDLGTAVHGMLERSFIDPQFVAPDPYGSDIKAVHDALASARLRVVDGYSERMIVHDRHQIAGTFDLLVEDETGQRFIADYKTGSSLLGALSFAIQLSIYANADALYNQGAAADGSEDTREPMPEVSKLHGVIIHVQPGSGHCDLHWLDLATGAEALELAIAVREMRKAKPLSPIVINPAAKAVALAEKHFPGSTRIEYVDDAWRGQVGIRLIAIVDIGAGNDVLANWPDNVPSLKSQEPLTLEQGEEILRLLADVERQHGIPFPDDPTPKPVKRTTKTSSRKPVAAEGKAVKQELIDALQAEAQLLPDAEWQWISNVSSQATTANREIRLGGPAGKATQRRYAIGQALITLAPQLDDDLTRTLVAHATNEPVNTTATLGDLIGQLNVEQATRFARLAKALDDLALTLAYSDTGEVQIAGDIEAVLAA